MFDINTKCHSWAWTVEIMWKGRHMQLYNPLGKVGWMVCYTRMRLIPSLVEYPKYEETRFYLLDNCSFLTIYNWNIQCLIESLHNTERPHTVTQPWCHNSGAYMSFPSLTREGHIYPSSPVRVKGSSLFYCSSMFWCLPFCIPYQYFVAFP